MRFLLKPRGRTLTVVAASLALHLLLSMLGFIHVPNVRVRPVSTQARYYPVHLYVPGGSRTEWTPKPAGRKRHVESNPASTTNLAISNQIAPPAGAPVSAPHDPVPGSGTDAENAFPAFPVFSPRPPITDRSMLPSTDRQVVVDVNVSATGDVVDAMLVKGIGNGLDQIVLNTVKTWRFHPATVNGNPVPTQAELIFPFNQSYPTVAS